VEPAGRRRARRARQVAFEEDRRPLPLDLRVGDRNRGEQRDRVRVERVVVEIVRGRELHDLPQVHHRDPVRDVPDDREVVRDEEVRELEVLLQLLHQVDDLRLDRDVERRHRLVADDEVRVERQRAREPDALPLSPRELVRVAAGGVGGETDRLQQLPHLLPQILPAPAVHAQRLADHASDGVAGVQRGVRILEDHLHAPSERSQLALAHVRDVGAVEDDPAGRRLVEPQQSPADRRLAAARFADEPERLAASDLEADPVDGLDVAHVAVEHEPALDREPDLQVLDGDQRVAAAGRAHAAPPSRSRSHSSAGTGLKQRTWWPGSSSSRGGTSSRDSSTS
jgi:hypothetical protein